MRHSPHTWKTFAFPIILLLAIYFNLYKLPLARHIPYKIFPWSSHPQIAKTSPEDLQLHIILSFSLLFVSYIKYLDCNIKIIDSVWCATQIAFSLIILPNVSHLGNYTPLIATSVNGGLLLTLFTLYYLNKPDWYFLVLSTPVLFETALYLTS